MLSGHHHPIGIGLEPKELDRSPEGVWFLHVVMAVCFDLDHGQGLVAWGSTSVLVSYFTPWVCLV